MSVLVTGRAGPRLLDGLVAHGVRARHVPHPQISDFDGVSQVYHVSDEFDPDMTIAAGQVFALALEAGVSLVGWQSRIGPYDVALPAGRHLAEVHAALWHLGIQFFIAQPAYPLSGSRTGPRMVLLCHRSRRTRCLPGSAWMRLPARSRPCCHAPIMKAGFMNCVAGAPVSGNWPVKACR